MKSSPSDSSAIMPIMPIMPSSVCRVIPSSTYFQPPPLFDTREDGVTTTLGDRLVLLAGGSVFGFACGFDAAMLIYALTVAESVALALGTGLVLAAMITVNLFVYRWIYKMRPVRQRQ